MTNLTFSSRHFYLLLTFHFLTTLPFLVISQPPPSELETMLKIKQHWGDQPYLQSWNSNISICDWPGINCTGESITGINLNSQSIQGTIPDFICHLKNLTILDLGNNYFQGNFPTFLYNCTKLQKLDLSSNLFVGQFPNDVNKLSPSLQHLILGANNFTGNVPASLAQLKELITLRLDSNLFNGTFPVELGTLSNLEELALAENPFLPMKLPKQFGMLQSLKILWMNQCNLIGEIPVEFGNLTSLQELDLMQNSLTGEIPSGLLSLKNLTYFYLYINQLSGEIPTNITALNLVEFDVSVNNLTGLIPEAIGNLKKLEILNLFENQFYGPIPSSIGLLPSLKKLLLYQNQFSGTVPPEIGLHSKLEDFDVSDNAFVGPLPENLCKGGALMGVVAFNNYMNGTIPTSLGQCNSLLAVRLDNNSFSGEVPQGIWSLKHMMIMQINNNQFSGQLPQNLAVNLSLVEFSNNQFSGNIPQGVGSNWMNLKKLKASNNLITGTVPLELTSLSQLNLLLLDGNQLTGELPSVIISWKRLTSLNLSHNHLSGSIPSALGSLPVLNNLDLSDNQFSGQIPPQLGDLKPVFLNLSSNFLTGSIPYGLDNYAYNASYLNTHLCSNTKFLNLPKCSIHRRSPSPKYLALIIVVTIVAFIAIVYLIVFTITGIRRRMNKEEDLTWNMTSFHKLNFSEEKIYKSLTENNLIGFGGSGEVYKIPINQKGDVVAVKRIWNKNKMNNSLEKEFISEVEILGTIRHNNIVKLLCCISSESSKLLVYEYMENQSLDKWIHTCKNRPMSSRRGTVHPEIMNWPDRLKVAIDCANGLSYMHNGLQSPIIHRDVKSSNILLDSEFNAKIADFGLAKILALPGENQDPASAVAGTFGYMAPEYCKTRKVNEKIDIYSYGVVLLELVTGKEANYGDEYTNLAEWAWKHQLQGNPIEDALDKQVLEAPYLEEMTQVFQVGLMCTSALPSDRPPMKEVLGLLQRFRGSETSSKVEDTKQPDFGCENNISSCKNSNRTADELV